MEDLSDLLEGIIMDIVGEGVGTTAGIALMWGTFFMGSFALFMGLLTLLADTI